MNKYYFKYFLIFIISFCSCSPAGRIQRAQKAEIRHLLKEKISTDKYSSYSFENMAVEIEGLINIKGNGKLYIKRNEFIFLTVQFVGMEIARLLVTSDSLYYINRLERKYLFAGIRDIQKKFSRRIDYHLIENLLVNGVLLPSKINPRHLVRFITKENDNYLFVIKNTATDKVSLIYNRDFVLNRIELIHSDLNTILNFELDYYGNQPGKLKTEGIIKNFKVLGIINMGKIGNHIIKKPEMNITSRYSEILL